MSRIPFLRGRIKAGRLFLLKAIRCTCGVLFYVDPRSRTDRCANCAGVGGAG